MVLLVLSCHNVHTHRRSPFTGLILLVKRIVNSFAFRLFGIEGFAMEGSQFLDVSRTYAPMEVLNALGEALNSHREALASHRAAEGSPAEEQDARRRSVVAAVQHLEQEFRMEANIEQTAEPQQTRLSTHEDRAEAWMSAVRNCVLLEKLSPSELQFVLKTARPIETMQGTTIFDQGDPIISGMLYLIGCGHYRAVVQTKRGNRKLSKSDA